MGLLADMMCRMDYNSLKDAQSGLSKVHCRGQEHGHCQGHHAVLIQESGHAALMLLMCRICLLVLQVRIVWAVHTVLRRHNVADEHDGPVCQGPRTCV